MELPVENQTPKYLYSFTISISWLLYFHFCPFLFFPPCLKIIIFDLPIFTVSLFFSTYFSSDAGILPSSFSSFATNTMSSANFSVYTFWLPISDSPSFLRSHIPSMSWMKRSKSSGLIEQPWRTPLAVLKFSVIPFPAIPRSTFLHIFFE